jgi:hypothetical protein
LAYLGIMGPQDGVDNVLEVAARVVHQHGRTDVRWALLGFGDCLADLKRRCTELGLDDYVTFTGRVGPAQITEYLSTATVGLGPDPKNPLNEVSTFNKTMEYLSYALPVLTYRLGETEVSAGDCAVYVEPGDTDGFAKALLDLLDDPDRRARMGARGRRRAERELDWRPQARAYVGVFDGLLGLRSGDPFPDSWPGTDRRDRRTGSSADRRADRRAADRATEPARTAEPADAVDVVDGLELRWADLPAQPASPHGHTVIDLRDESVLQHFARTRGVRTGKGPTP